MFRDISFAAEKEKTFELLSGIPQTKMAQTPPSQNPDLSKEVNISTGSTSFDSSISWGAASRKLYKLLHVNHIELNCMHRRIAFNNNILVQVRAFFST